MLDQSFYRRGHVRMRVRVCVFVCVRGKLGEEGDREGYGEAGEQAVGWAEGGKDEEGKKSGQREAGWLTSACDWPCAGCHTESH